MKIIRDFERQSIRLTEERSHHILEHPEMQGMSESIIETLQTPQKVMQSLSDPDAHLYYRFYIGTRVGDKYLCVVAKITSHDAFILTAYLTDTIKKGVVLWQKKS